MILRGSTYEINDYEDLGGTNLDALSHGDVLHKRIYALPLAGGSVLGRPTIATLLLEPSNGTEPYLSPSEGQMSNKSVFKRVGLLLIDETESDSLWRWGLTASWRMESKQELVIV